MSDTNSTSVAAMPCVLDGHPSGRLRSLARLPSHLVLSELLRLNRQYCRLQAELLLFLGELDHRQIYREHAVASAFEFCVCRLGCSEDVAWKRVGAARLMRKFPRIYGLLAEGRLHLTALMLLKPHLTDDNHEEWLLAACGKSKRQIEKLIAARCPRPDVPAIIRKLPGTSSTATPEILSSEPASDRGEVTQDVASEARGEAVSEVMDEPTRGATREATGEAVGEATDEATRGATDVGTREAVGEATDEATRGATREAKPAAMAPAATTPAATAPLAPAATDPSIVPASAALAATAPFVSTGQIGRRSRVEPLSGTSYRITFTASERLTEKLQQAGELLSHCVSPNDLPALFERALDALIEREEKRRYGARQTKISNLPCATSGDEAPKSERQKGVVAVKPRTTQTTLGAPGAEPKCTEALLGAHVAEPRSTEPRSTEPRSTEPRSTEPRSTEPPSVARRVTASTALRTLSQCESPIAESLVRAQASTAENPEHLLGAHASTTENPERLLGAHASTTENPERLLGAHASKPRSAPKHRACQNDSSRPLGPKDPDPVAVGGAELEHGACRKSSRRSRRPNDPDLLPTGSGELGPLLDKDVAISAADPVETDSVDAGPGATLASGHIETNYVGDRSVVAHEAGPGAIGHAATPTSGQVEIPACDNIHTRALADRSRTRRRWIPVKVRRAVFERDGGRCTYVSAQGRRCGERCYLEFDHIEAHALGGSETIENIRLRCRSHNRLAAEQLFGSAQVRRAARPAKHA